jgi:Rrf2 family protein
MNNVRFATALHILTLLAISKGEWLSSAYIAGSIHINPVLVRKEISHLRKQGLLASREGKGGGSTLAKPASAIWLSDIYEAVRQSPLLGRANKPNPACPVGKQINQHLDTLYAGAEEALVRKLKELSLADFVRQFS